MYFCLVAFDEEVFVVDGMVANDVLQPIMLEENHEQGSTGSSPTK